VDRGAQTVIEFRLLGALEVVDGDRPLTLGRPKQRALLAVLLLHRGEPVSSERLVDELWGQEAPASAIKIVQGYVSSLRKELGDGVLVTRGHGYLLAAAPGQVDVDRFESLVAEGRRALQEGDPRVASQRLRGALGVWRGPPLADFAYESFAQAEIARLQESRLGALEERIDAELALGEHAQLVGELEGLVREHPLRERLIGQLMLALYRSGRQADALETYREARRRLVEELGIEPSSDLQQLERAILTQDPALKPPTRRDGRGPVIARGRRHGGPLVAAGGAVLLAVLVLVAVRLPGSSATVRVAPNQLAAIDVRSDRVVGTASVGARPGAVAFGSGSLWVANLDDQTISRVDPRTMQTLAAIRLGRPPTGIAASPGGGVWVVESNLNPYASFGPGSVLVRRVDPDFDTLTTRVAIGNVDQSAPGAIAARHNSVWVAPSSGLLTRLNAPSGAVQEKLDPNASPTGIAIGAGAVWLTDADANNVVRVDPSGLPTPIAVGDEPTAITVGAGGVWVVDSFDDAVVRIDPDTQSVTATIPVGHSPSGVAFGAGSVWVANSADGTVTRINPHTDKVQATIVVGGSPQALTVADGRVWVTVDAQSITPANRGSGGATLRMVSSYDIGTMDPAAVGDPQLLYATCAQLVSYPDKPIPASWQLTPEVAQALPTRSADGRTYTFKIRPGFRFSPPSDQPVTAQTFKDTIERTLNPRIHSWFAPYLADVVGARAYMTGNASHITGVVANGDTLTIRLLNPAPNLPALLASPAFCAVPSGTPIGPSRVRTIPSAGPYYVTSDTPRQGVVLTRNPNYHGSRPHHFQRIELAVGISVGRAITEIQAGTADYTSPGVDSIPASTTMSAVVSRLAARYGSGSAAAARGMQQYFVNPGLQLDYFDLNTHRPLFSDVRVRQAVNYAIDRRELAHLGDNFEPIPEQPTDHYLVPGMPGFRNAHVYPVTPDLTKARQLIQQAHAQGRTAVLYTCNASPCPQQAQIVKSDLAQIGLRVQIKRFPIETMFAREATPGEPFDLAWNGQLPDYQDPQAMLSETLEDNSVDPTFKDRRYQRKLAAAAQRSGPERYLTYGALDLDLARHAAPLAAFGNLPSVDFFSARIGCQTYSVYGMDLAALCIRNRTH
jgi:YVTN family beta-propeller protein